jgi:hypothetical protein
MNPKRRIALKRMLFIYAKLNPRISYVQGMNEILAPIFYVVAQDPAFNLAARRKRKLKQRQKMKAETNRHKKQMPTTQIDKQDNDEIQKDMNTAEQQQQQQLLVVEDKDDSQAEEDNEQINQAVLDGWAEADTFNCFSNIMVEVCDLFTREMDSGSSGITGQLKNFNEIFHRACPSLAAHFDSLQVDPQFYAFRWLTTLGTRELELPEVVRLWDSLLADEHRFKFLDYFCVALVVTRYDDLIDRDFSKVLSILQERTPLDFQAIFRCAKKNSAG